jgi:hypothetical protein
MQRESDFIDRDSEGSLAVITEKNPHSIASFMNEHLFVALRAILSKPALGQSFELSLKRLHSLGKVFNNFEFLKQANQHFDPIPYLDSFRSKRGKNFQEFHMSSFEACVDRSVGGVRTLWRTVYFVFSSHSGFFEYPQMEAV